MPPFSNLSLSRLSSALSLSPRSGAGVVGLDIQPGFAVAVQASVNGSIRAERAACLALPADIVRAGEVLDEGALSEALRELFAGRRLSKRVRLGVANQRTVMRTLELPPVDDRKELAAAVRYQAEDQVPMPLSNAVLDFQPLGIIETPSGPRQRVVLVAAQRDMIERLLSAVRGAGLQPVGVDLSAFALIRSLYRGEGDPERTGRVVYLNVDGLTNLAIAEGTVCRFTRMVGGGLEGMAVELAERLGMPLIDARAKLLTVDLGLPPGVVPLAANFDEGVEDPMAHTPFAQAGESPGQSEHLQTGGYGEEEGYPGEQIEPGPEVAAEGVEADAGAQPGEAGEGGEWAYEGGGPAEGAAGGAPAGEQSDELSAGDHETLESSMSFAELSAVEQMDEEPPQASDADSYADAHRVLENGIREICGEVRNSLDFHRSQEGGGDVSHVVLSGSALDIPGFAEALQGHLGLEVRAETVEFADDGAGDPVSTHRLAVATGLAAEEVHP